MLPAFLRFFVPRLQLLDTKSTDRKETLMHFIVRIIQEKYPDVQNFYSELHFLDKAALGEYGRILGFGIHNHVLLLLLLTGQLVNKTFFTSLLSGIFC